MGTSDYIVTPTISSAVVADMTTKPPKDFKLIPIWLTVRSQSNAFMDRGRLRLSSSRTGKSSLYRVEPCPLKSKRLDELYASHMRGRDDNNFMPAIGRTGDWDADLIADNTADEFRGLLKLTCRFASEEPEAMTVDDWMSVLKLAKLWDMPETHAQTVKSLDEEIQKRSAAEKIILGRRYDVETWSNEGFTVFLYGAAISIAERDELGWETYARLLEARDKAWAYAEADYNTRSKSNYRGAQAQYHRLRQASSKHDLLYHEAFGPSWSGK